MNAFKKGMTDVFLLIKDLGLLGYKMVKQIILPTKRTKGNIISSLFLFFIGIIERLNNFELGFLNMAAIFRLKYIKQLVVVICTLLFFLSSFEWSSANGLCLHEESQQSEQLSQGITKSKTNQLCQPVEVKEVCFNKTQYTVLANLYCSPNLKEKTYLLIHSLRI
jgi:hypothetical protein